MIVQYTYNSDKEISLIPDLLNKVHIYVNTDPVYQVHASLPNMNESHFLCVLVLVPVEK